MLGLRVLSNFDTLSYITKFVTKLCKKKKRKEKRIFDIEQVGKKKEEGKKQEIKSMKKKKKNIT